MPFFSSSVQSSEALSVDPSTFVKFGGSLQTIDPKYCLICYSNLNAIINCNPDAHVETFWNNVNVTPYVLPLMLETSKIFIILHYTKICFAHLANTLFKLVFETLH